MPAITPEKNREHRHRNYDRRSRAFDIVKLLAARAGFMQNQRDTAGLDQFMDSFHGDEIDWFQAIEELQEK